MAISKKKRLEVYDKCAGRCAYCGQKIAYKDMNVDHVVPLHRNVSRRWVEDMGHKRGTDDIDNLLPACRMCNTRKGESSLETFREEISLQAQRACKTFQVRMSMAYGIFTYRPNRKVVFYFEKMNKGNNQLKNQII